MDEPSQPLSKKLETPAFWATAIGLTAAAAAVVTGSLPLAVGGFLLGLVACSGPAVAGLREDDAWGGAPPEAGIDGEKIAEGVGRDGVGEETSQTRFRELVLRPPAGGRSIH